MQICRNIGMTFLSWFFSISFLDVEVDQVANVVLYSNDSYVKVVALVESG